MAARARSTAINPWISKLASLPLLLVLVAGFLWWVHKDVDDLELDSSKGACSLEAAEHTNRAENNVYPWLLHRRFHDGKPPVALVTLEPPSVPLSVLSNVCDSREFMSFLIPALVANGALVIAIDKFYSAGACPDGRRENLHLSASIKNVPANVHVVVGQATRRKASATDGLDDSCLVLTPAFDFGGAGDPSHGGRSGKVLYGLTRLNENSAQIPLAWPVLKDDSSTQIATMPGFALVAAEQLGSKDLRESGLDFVAQERIQEKHPFGFFEDIASSDAMDVLCSTPAKVPLPWSCPPAGRHRHYPFEGKVVVVGEKVSTDRQPFLGGSEYGVNLQAQYIDALLSNRFLREVPSCWEWDMVKAFILLFAGCDLLTGTLWKPWLRFGIHKHQDLWNEGTILAFGLLLLAALCALNYWLVMKYMLYAPVFLLSLKPIGMYLLLRMGWFVLNFMRDLLTPEEAL